MTRTEFGFWLRGLASSSGSTDELAAVVLGKAEEILAARAAPTRRVLPAHWKPLAVPAFCAHNIHVTESCPACARVPNGGLRVFTLNLPQQTHVVYIAGHADRIVQDAMEPRGERAGSGVADAHHEPPEKILD